MRKFLEAEREKIARWSNRPAETLAERIRRLRETAGLTREQLAQRALVPQAMITRLEQGTTLDPHWSAVVAIAGALGVSPDAFLGAELRKPGPPPAEGPENS